MTTTVMFVLLILLEVIAASIAFETDSEIASRFYLYLILLNAIPIYLISISRKRLAVTIAMILALWIVPKRMYGAFVFYRVSEESANVVNYCYSYKIKNGNFPERIDENLLTYPESVKRIPYKKVGDNFSVSYFINTRTTSHYYIHNVGPKWNYYPD
ncbi:MAG: hypothetical protein HKN92_06920 [Chitinophagales bacterium]|nr:hypothetical protein [Chitinophagales bacterium]